jgi:hypothetical protein
VGHRPAQPRGPRLQRRPGGGPGARAGPAGRRSTAHGRHGQAPVVSPDPIGPDFTPVSRRALARAEFCGHSRSKTAQQCW